jgi:hypothetical protein
MTTESKPLFKGFNIELPSSNIHLNIQDIYGNIVSGAQVVLSNNEETCSNISNVNGCVSLIMEQGLIYDVNIIKAGYKTYSSKITMISNEDLENPNSNFILNIVDTNNIPIQDADVNLTNIDETIEGKSNAKGIFETKINLNLTYNLNISKNDYGIFSSKINSFIKFTCTDTNYLIISVINI